MSESFAKKMAIEYAKEMKRQALKANLKKAAANVQTREIDGRHAQVVVPHELAENAFVFNYGLRHPLNYKNQRDTDHPKYWQRWMARTPKRPFLKKTADSIPTADRALDAGMDDLIKNEWDDKEF